MTKKERKHTPKCEGRFGELRGLFYETAREIRRIKQDPLWPIVTQADITDFLDLAWGGGFEPITLFDVTDPYFLNRRDTLRGDPLVGNRENFGIALIPFIFEAMRETLYENVGKAIDLTERLRTREDRVLLLLETEDLTNRPFDKLELLQNGDLVEEILKPICNRDFTITQNSVYPTLLERYARLYVVEGDIDRLNLFHMGVVSLDRELGMSLHKVMVPTLGGHKGDKYVPLSGYHLRAEFGTGPNTTRNLISSAPYRVELYKKQNHGGDIPVFGMNFYLRHPDIMVVSQIQDIRGSKVPEGTTDGLCSLVVAEKIAAMLGLKQILTYTHRNNPVLYLYPGEGKLMSILRINFDEAARTLGWKSITEEGKNGEIMGYRRKI